MFGFARNCLGDARDGARPDPDPFPLARHPKIETFSIARIGRDVVCHAGKHAIAWRWTANRRTRGMGAPR